MSPIAQQFLAAFDSLSEYDRETVIAELLLRNPVGAGALPDTAFVESADKLFRAYDAKEAADSLTDAQRQDMDRRIAAYEADPKAGRSWDEVKGRLVK
jgi:putative addiction module component (TIGR02574 family)